MRKNAREDAFRLLFEQNVNPEEAAEKLTRYFETAKEEQKAEEPFYVNRPSEQDRTYTRVVVEGVQKHLAEIDALIQENLKDWEMDRVSKISIAVLRLSIYEILHMEDIPAEVSASEAVAIAKKYDSPSAGSFVNGVLGNIIRNQ
ncbi:MAG: transcription antitermination factor NusB [Ruminococcaceae bacterium]|nr:transcription antitermination factor NusB [Oscillospiraceae bacterium]